ncbi:hypothetical protein EYF80_065427 [Liparis tanakae]|uniref:Uncharacterized protein n=1 Tax=Liparis tanakae TaxID=230148 RepID=A0A4Z2E6M4_9TELE|nr:hypothetical protein EYF80_065427 [Liparis tanakae]
MRSVRCDAPKGRRLYNEGETWLKLHSGTRRVVHLVEDLVQRVLIDVHVDALGRDQRNEDERRGEEEEGETRLTSRTCWTSTVVMKPRLSLSNLWKRFLYLRGQRSEVSPSPSLQLLKQGGGASPGHFLVVQVDLGGLGQLFGAGPVAHLQVQELPGRLQLGLKGELNK